MPEMQALKVTKPDHNPGAAGELKKVPVPEPKNAEVVIKLLLRPVNPADVFTLMVSGLLISFKGIADIHDASMAVQYVRS
jgi:NADPH:quinone reductase-like Zn-dependent oxidoreductase